MGCRRRGERSVRDGFSLIELSTVIAVAATVAVGYLSWTQPKQRNLAAKTRVTLGRLSDITNAIQSFKVRHGRLPCPADPFMRANGTRASDAAVQFWQSAYGTENMDRTDEDANETLGEDCPYTEGALPIFALELTEDYMNDGWDRRFTYRVSSRLCGADVGVKGGGLPEDVSRNTGCTTADYSSNTGDIVIDGPNGMRLNSNAAFVVLSHGANGYGAFLPSGSRLPFPAVPNPSELANADGYSFSKPATFNPNAVFIKDETSHDGGYDDIMVFRTRAQLESLTRDDNTPLMTRDSCREIKNIISSADFDQLLDAADQSKPLQDALKRGEGLGNGSSLMMITDTLQRLCGAYYSYSKGSYVCPKGGTWETLTGSSDASKGACQF